MGCRFFDLDAEVEKFHGTSIERLQNRSPSMDDFRKKCAAVLIHLATRESAEDIVVALPPRGLMGPYLRAVRVLGAVTVALRDRPENILSRIAFYDIDSKPIEKRLTRVEERLYLKEIKEDLAYFGRSYAKADLQVDLADTRGIEEAAAKVDEAFRVHLDRRGRAG